MLGLGGFFAFRRPSGLGGGLRTKGGVMSSSAFRFVPPLASGLRFVGRGLVSIAGSAFRLARNGGRGLVSIVGSAFRLARFGITLERIARAFARPGVSGSRRVHPTARFGLSARFGLRERGLPPTLITGAAFIFPMRSLKLGGADGGKSGSAGGADGCGIVKPVGVSPAEEPDAPPLMPV